MLRRSDGSREAARGGTLLCITPFREVLRGSDGSERRAGCEYWNIERGPTVLSVKFNQFIPKCDGHPMIAILDRHF